MLACLHGRRRQYTQRKPRDQHQGQAGQQVDANTYATLRAQYQQQMSEWLEFWSLEASHNAHNFWHASHTLKYAHKTGVLAQEGA